MAALLDGLTLIASQAAAAILAVPRLDSDMFHNREVVLSGFCAGLAVVPTGTFNLLTPEPLPGKHGDAVVPARRAR